MQLWGDREEATASCGLRNSKNLIRVLVVPFVPRSAMATTGDTGTSEVKKNDG